MMDRVTHFGLFRVSFEFQDITISAVPYSSASSLHFFIQKILPFSPTGHKRFATKHKWFLEKKKANKKIAVKDTHAVNNCSANLKTTSSKSVKINHQVNKPITQLYVPAFLCHIDRIQTSLPLIILNQ